MTELPDDVALSLVRGVGTYIREIPPQELPAKLRRYRGFRPQALNAHRKALLAVLDDDAERPRIAHWLENDKPPLSKEDARLLGIATARENGWEDELGAAGKPRSPKAAPRQDADSKLEAERDKTRRAKEELKKAKDELRQAQQAGARRIAELEAAIEVLERQLAETDSALTRARKEAERVAAESERAQRKAKTTVEKAQSDRDEARKESKELRKEIAALKSELARATKTETPAARPQKKTPQPKKRSALRVPKGRLGDDPATLEGWLARDDVRMVVDGYNVAKADGGYEDLQLESQRERLVDALFTLAKMTDTETIVVFDAQRVPGRRTRRARRPVIIEWSNPGEIADDYIVHRLQELPPEPVVLVTNDRELQQRGRELDASIATSQQLLALLR